ncbi:MAG: PQQ-binding-like beta-propeller repeat protein [Phycisphaerae bacterium]|nr:PQQ-binding-like beta-propeller repeat protein [Gemmatimonadaceae bacterium]
MARSRNPDVMYIGVGSHVVAIQMSTGEELWRTKVKRATYMTLSRDGDRIFAGASGELFCIDRNSGEILWHNKLKGLGLGLVAFSGTSETAMMAAAAAAAAAGAAAGAAV